MFLAAISKAKNCLEYREHFIKKKYLGHTKSSGQPILFSYKLLRKIFFFYEKIERLLLYLSMLFDHYSIDIIIINLSEKLFFV
jgi:hypothetical protein